MPERPGENVGLLDDYDDVVELFRRGASSAVHAYAIVGPAGAPLRAVATAAAQALVCCWAGERESGARVGCGTCSACRRVVAGTHPDVVVFARVGPYLTVEQLSEAIRIAQRAPVELARKVIMLVDLHLLPMTSAPMILKTLEEPPPSTVFLITAQRLDGPLETIASRCVVSMISSRSLTALTALATERGVGGPDASLLARLAGGDERRMLHLLDDPDAIRRARFWSSLPERVDGTAAQAMALAREGLALCEAAQPIQGGGEAEDDEGVQPSGKAATVRRREQRRARTDELRAGLAVLADRVRECLADVDAAPAATVALAKMERFFRELVRNPQELAQLADVLSVLPQSPRTLES